MEGIQSQLPFSRLPSIPIRAYVFGVMMAGMGFLTLVFSWLQLNSVENPQRYFSYLIVAVLCALLSSRVQRKAYESYALSVIFVLLGIIELNYSQTLTLGCTPVLVHFLLNPEVRSKPLHLVVSISSLATAITSARFVYQSVLPDSMDNLHVRLFIASVAFFIMNTFPSAVITGLCENKRFSKTWREMHFWSFPYYLVGAAAGGVIQMTRGQGGSAASILILPVMYLIQKSYHQHLVRMREMKQHSDEVSKLCNKAIEGLAMAVEAKDANTRSHLLRVQIYSVEMGRLLGLPANDLKNLQTAAILHDVGKLAIPEHILSKPARLSQEEFACVKSHTVVGADLLMEMEFPPEVVEIVRSHHERWDGSGYPAGLSGEHIPIGARILSVADCFDALRSNRDYRRAVSPAEAMKIVGSEAGKSYDPQVVSILTSHYHRLEGLVQEKVDGLTARKALSRIDNATAPMAGIEQPQLSPDNLLESIASARRESVVLLNLTQELMSCHALVEIVRVIAMRASEMIPGDAIGIYMLRDHVLESVYASGAGAPVLARLKVPINKGMIGWVAGTNIAILNGNPLVEPGLPDQASNVMGLRSALAVPLEDAGRVLAVLAVYRCEPHAFRNDELRVAKSLALVASQAIGNAALYSDGTSLDETDPVTSLPNIRALYEKLDEEVERCRQQDLPLAVLVCDLDGFKNINDSFGYLEGNRLLQTVAERLRGSCRAQDSLARMGADEFVVVLPGAQPEDLSSQIQRLGEAVEDAGRDLDSSDGGTTSSRKLSLNVGAAFYPRDGQDSRQLLALADHSMYKTKNQKKSAAANV